MVERPHIFACAKCGTVFGPQSATDALAAAERRGEAKGLKEAAEKAVRERTRTSLYELSYQAGTHHAGETWSVYGDGFGLRCYAQKEQAVREATEFFGLARFVIRIWPEKSVLHVTTAPGADPEKLLNQAIDALKAELAELNKCPAHARTARLLTEGKNG